MRKKIILVSSVLLLSAFSFKGFNRVEEIKIEDTTRLIPAKKRSFEEFLDSLAFRESSDRWWITNSKGYIGKYQFGKSALKDLKRPVSLREFRKNPEIFPEEEQDLLIRRYIKLNIKYLGSYYNDYNGKVINGIRVTKSGMVAASHLVGYKSVKNWLDSNGKKNKKDGYGTSLESYMEKFAGYEITP